jgi:hypothetical protein
MQGTKNREVITHTHTHTYTLSHALTHTHTHTCTYTLQTLGVLHLPRGTQTFQNGSRYLLRRRGFSWRSSTASCSRGERTSICLLGLWKMTKRHIQDSLFQLAVQQWYLPNTMLECWPLNRYFCLVLLWYLGLDTSGDQSWLGNSAERDDIVRKQFPLWSELHPPFSEVKRLCH